MNRCDCGQYPDVCARYGHAGGHEPPPDQDEPRPQRERGDVLAGRLRLLADRLDDGYQTFAGKIVTEELREAADLLDGVVRVEYGVEFIDPHPNDRVMMWTDSVWDRWPQNEAGPWGMTVVNNHPVKVVRRTVTYSRWSDCPKPQEQSR